MVSRLTYSRLAETDALRRWPLAADAEGDVLLQSGSYVIPGLTPIDQSQETTCKTQPSHTARGFLRFLSRKITIPPFSRDLPPVFGLIGGCHD